MNQVVTTTAGVTAALAYSISSYFLINGLRHNQLNRPLILLTGCLALISHGFLVFGTIIQPLGLQLGVFAIACLFTWVVTTMGTLSSLLRHIEPLLAPSYPLALVSVILTLLFQDTLSPRSGLSSGLLAHIVTSLIAYSLVTLAFSQAILLWIQNYQLKHRHIHDILQLLPPLQSMEETLYDLVFASFLMLAVAIVTGFIYVDDIFAQHLAHKTLLTLLAWLVFGYLIFGRFVFGWRGMIAVRWTLAGFALLMLGFFGSKVVLELILQNG